MATLHSYVINLHVEGLEINTEDFIEFLEYFKTKAGDLITWQQDNARPHLIEISVPSPTSLLMLGILWNQFDSIDKAGIRININDDEDFDDDDFGIR